MKSVPRGAKKLFAVEQQCCGATWEVRDRDDSAFWRLFSQNPMIPWFLAACWVGSGRLSEPPGAQKVLKMGYFEASFARAELETQGSALKFDRGTSNTGMTP